MAGPRRLTTLDATLLVMGGIIGVGIFYKPGEVARLLPETAPYFSAWAIGALAAVAGAMTFAELAALLPREGGWFEYLREGVGRLPAFLFAWIVLLVVSTGASAGVAEFCALQVASVAGWEASPSALRGLAAVIVLGVTAMGCRGVKTGAVLQNACMAAKLLAIAVFVVAGLALVAPAAPAAPPSGAPSIPTGLVRATLPVLFTFGGWQLVTYIAPSVEDPVRTLPRAILGGVAGVAAVYGLLNLAYVRVLGLPALATEPDVASALAVATLGDHGARFLSGAMAISALGFLVATLISTPGIYVAMARQGLFFASAGRVHPRTGAPVNALLVQAAVCCLYLAWTGDVKGQLGDSVVFAEWIFHGLCALALLRLAPGAPDRPFRSPLFPLFPALYALIATGVVVGNLGSSPWSVTSLGLGVLALGAVVYGAWSGLLRRAD